MSYLTWRNEHDPHSTSVIFSFHKRTQPKNAQVATNVLTSYNNLLQQADIRMRSRGLLHLVDDVANCQQTCCKLIVQTCYPQACCKLYQQD